LLDPNELDVSGWKDVIDQLAKLGTEKIVYSGGEPTLKDGFCEIVDYTVQKGIKYAFISNGYRLPPKVCKTINAAPPYAVGISIDGTEAVHNSIRGKTDSWSRALKTIKGLKENGHQVCAVTTVSKWNLHVLDDLAEFLSETVDSWQIQLASPFGRMKDQTEALLSEEEFQHLCKRVILFRSLYDDLNIQAADCFGMADAGLIRSTEWEGCSAGLWTMGIDACGNVLPCLSIQNGITGGNVKSESLVDIWHNSECFRLNRNPDFLDASRGQCGACKLLERCRGGCASLSYAYTGKFHRVPLCYHRSFCDPCQEGGVKS
jgi:radical SAM protein with 4Fe4S-binding SPASM domain